MTSSPSGFGVRSVIASATILISVIAVLGLIIPGSVFAAGTTLYVDSNAAAVGQDGSPAHPYQSIQTAVNAASAGDTIHVTGKNTVTSRININVPLTITGYPSAEIDTTGSDYMFVINPGAAGTTITYLTLYKVDSVDATAIVQVNANNVSITSNFIRGMYTIGDSHISRGIEVANGASGLYVSNNTFNGLRQPAYINNASGTVDHNTTQVTKGWVVVSDSNITFTDNSWGTGSQANVVDIAIIPDSPAGANNYPDVQAISQANHNALVINKAGAATQQSEVYVNGTTGNDSNDGSNLSPLKTIPTALTRIVANGTVHVAAGTYAGPLTLTKNGVSLLGAPGTTVTESTNDLFGYGATVDTASNVTISNIDFVSTQTSGYAFHAFKANGLTLNSVTFTGPGKTGAHIGGVDINTSNTVTLNGVSSTGFYKNGIAVTSKYLASDTGANGITFNNVSSTNNGWSGISFYTVGNDHSPASIGGSASMTGVTFTGTDTISGNSLVGLHIEGDSDAHEGAAATPANTVTTDGTTLDLSHVAFSSNGIYDIVNYQTAPVNAMATTFNGLTGTQMSSAQRTAEDSKIVDQHDHAAYGLVTYYGVTVTIDAYVNGAEASSASTAGTAFPMHAVFPGGEGDYTLSISGFNNPDAYKATTSVMPVGSNYSTYQTAAAIANKCTADYPFRLVGYGTGATLADAAAANPSITTPSFTNLTSDQFVVVFIKTCPPAPTPVTPTMSGTTVTNAELPKIDWSDVSDSLGPVASYNYEVALSPEIGLYGGFASPIYSVSLTTSENPNGGTPDGTYYWHEQAVDAAGHPGPWTAPMYITFHTEAAPAAAAVTTNDATNVTSSDAQMNATNGPNDATGHSFWVSQNPITVSSDPGTFPADTYSTQDLGTIAANSPFDALLSDLVSNGAPSNMPALVPGTTYHYVAWVLVDGHWLRGEDKTVTLDSDNSGDALAAPAGTFPSNGASLSSSDLTHITWTAVSNAHAPISYVYEVSYSSGVSGDGSFATPIDIGNAGHVTTNEIATGGTPPGTYYWHVRAVDSVDTSSDWSTVQSFIITAAAPVNHAPTAGNQSATVAQGSSVTITLDGADADGDSLTYEVGTAPTHGTVTVSQNIATYTANEVGYTGSDSFTYNVSDGTVTVPTTGTVSITVTPAPHVNAVPTANAQEVSVNENSSAAITLSGNDADGDSLIYTIVNGPAHGALSGTAPAVTYTPAADYIGNDSFTFVVFDGTATSSPATVSITVNAVQTTTPAQQNSSFFGNGGGSGVSGQFAAPQSSGSTGSVGGSVLGASTYNFAKNLTVGSRGEDVTQLQMILISEGFLHLDAPSGYFGALTKAAVKLYQAAHNITPAAGYVGPITRALLNQGATPKS